MPRLKPADRETAAQRAGGHCEYCRSPEDLSPSPFSIEHVNPAALRGATELENLALSCQGCNNHKYTCTDALDRISGISVPLFNPRRDRWADHFGWADDFTLIVGLTPVGRVTVEPLKLKRRGVVNLRRALRALGRHPPDDGR